MWRNVSFEQLHQRTVPHVCAKTGVRTDRLRKHWLVQRRRIPWWWWLVFGFLAYKVAWFTGHTATIWLPVTRRRLYLHRFMRFACVAYVVAYFAIGDAIGLETMAAAPAWTYLLGSWTGFALLVSATHRTWVQPRLRSGIIRLRDPHPEFLDAIRNTPVFQQEDGTWATRYHGERIMPGWYEDPSGQHTHRYWNGGGWTESVMGTRT